MKKFFIPAAVALIALSFAACGDSGENKAKAAAAKDMAKAAENFKALTGTAEWPKDKVPADLIPYTNGKVAN